MRLIACLMACVTLAGVWCGRRLLGTRATSATGFDVRPVAASWRCRATGAASVGDTAYGFGHTAYGFGDRWGCIVQSVTRGATDLYVGAESAA